MQGDFKNDFYFLRGGGKMGELIRATDWSKTPLGDPETWPHSLRVTISMILNSSFPMFLWWGEDLIQFYNDAYRPSLGNDGKHPKAIGQKGKECWPEIWEIIHPLIEQVRTKGKPTWSEDQLIPIYRNGKIEDVYWTFGYSPIFGDSENIEGVLVVCTETTEKIQAKKAVEESEERFRNMAESSDILISVADRDLKTTYFNNSWATFTGRPINDLLNFGWAKFMHADDYDVFMNLYKKAYETKQSFSSEFRMLNCKGEYRWLLVKITARYKPDGSLAGYVSSGVDITERVEAGKAQRESEEEIRSLIESAPFPIGVYKGKQMRIEFANQSIMDVWGKGNNVIGKLFSEVLPELDNQEVFKQLDHVYNTGIPFHIKNQQIDLVVDGKMRPYYFNYSFIPLFDASGKVYGVMNTAADVTDLNLAKQKIEQSEKNFRNMVLQAPVAMCILLGPEHIVEVANELMIELWGKPKEVVMGKPIFDGLPDAKGQGLEKLMEDVFVKGETFTANEMPVILFRNGQNETVYQNFVYEPYKDSDGTILGVLTISIDVTVQVLARKKIEEAEGRARLAINSAELGVYEVTYSTNEVITDNRFKEIWGVDQSITRPGYASYIHPDDQPLREAAHKASLKSGQLYYQARIVWKDKSIHWVRITGKVIYDDKNNPLKLIGVIQDITTTILAQQKIEESMQNLRNTILQAPVAMCILRGPTHIVELANERMIELWGKTEADVANTPILKALPEIEGEGFDVLLENVYKTGETFVANDAPVTLLRNGKPQTVFVNFVYEAYREVDGSISGILAIAVDVSPQVIARQKIEDVVSERTKELADVNNSLQKSNAELAQFAYIASHDLQEPLRKISTFSQMLENKLEGKIDDQSKNLLHKINNSSLRMNKLIRDVLTYSELVKENEVFSEVNLNEIIENIKTDFDLLIEQKRAVINTKDLPVIQAIPLQMSQLFSNLISNALKYVRNDTDPVITITSARLNRSEIKALMLNEDLEYFNIRFSDNGIGIKQEYTQQIFNIFQRLHRKSEFEGTGIGLAMCKKIVLNHSGLINAKDSTENGAVFNVVLPVRQTS